MTQSASQEFEDMVRLANLLAEGSENDFLNLAANQELNRRKWLEAVSEAQRLQNLVSADSHIIFQLENQILQAESLLLKEKELRCLAEEDRDLLEKQMSRVRELTDVSEERVVKHSTPLSHQLRSRGHPTNKPEPETVEKGRRSKRASKLEKKSPKIVEVMSSALTWELPPNPTSPVITTAQLESTMHEGAMPHLNLRPHTFSAENVFDAELCDLCGKPIPVGTIKMNCLDCGACCHTGCKQSFPLPCIPMTGTPSNSNLVCNEPNPVQIIIATAAHLFSGCKLSSLKDQAQVSHRS